MWNREVHVACLSLAAALRSSSCSLSIPQLGQADHMPYIHGLYGPGSHIQHSPSRGVIDIYHSYQCARMHFLVHNPLVKQAAICYPNSHTLS
jgi:hypothetical protein